MPRKHATLIVAAHRVAEARRIVVLYRGIAARNFERSFQLADHVQVKGASLEVLHIDLCTRSQRR